MDNISLEGGSILFIYFTCLCVSLLLTCFKDKGAIRANYLNIFVTSIISLYMLLSRGISLGTHLLINEPESVCLSIVGFLVVSLIIHGKRNTTMGARINLIYSLLLFASYIFMGAREWISIFLCYKAITIALYPLIFVQKDTTSKSRYKNALLVSITEGILFAMMAYFYYLATGSFSIYKPTVLNQQFFVLSLSILIILLSANLGLFPFNLWMRKIVYHNDNEGLIVVLLLRKVICSYLLVITARHLFELCDPKYQALLTDIITYYALLNAIVCGLLILVENRITEFVEMILAMGMSVILLSITMVKVDALEEHLSFYLLFALIPFVCANLLFSTVSNLNKDLSMRGGLRGLFNSNPLATLLMMLFMLNIISCPLTAGFSSKYLMYYDLIGHDFGLVVFVLVLMYIIPIRAMYILFRSLFLETGSSNFPAKIAGAKIGVYYFWAFLTVIGGLTPYILVGRA